jgi:molecular chaperone DnaJ
MPAQREWFEKDYYKVLGVPDSATEKEVKTAFRKLSKQHHPDSGGDEEKFKEVSAAFDVLGDAAKRKEYDEVRRLGPIGQAFGGGGGQNFTFTTDDLGDLFGGLFNRVRGGGRRSSANAGPRRGQDLETALHLSFEDAVRGITTSVNLTSDVVCHQCHGTGAAPGTSPIVCPTCNGRGVTDENQGFFSFSQPCRDCGGSGMRVETPCPNCHGSGVERRARQVKVRTPAGVQDGQRIRLKGKGGAGANGGPPGDLYVFVQVGTHRLFGRKGRDLTLNLPLTFPEATLGTTVKVPTLDGPVTLRIPPGTRPGRTFRVKGHGVPGAGNTKPGDLLVTVEVAVPEKLSDEEKAAVEALKAASNGKPSPREHLGVES